MAKHSQTCVGEKVELMQRQIPMVAIAALGASNAMKITIHPLAAHRCNDTARPHQCRPTLNLARAPTASYALAGMGFS